MLALLLSLITADTLNLTVNQALDMALKQSTVAAQARLTRASGQSQYLRAWSLVTPTLNGSGGVGWHIGPRVNHDTTLTHGWSMGISASQVLFDPSVFGNIASSNVNRSIADLQASSDLNQQVWNVRTGYYGLQELYGLYDLADTTVKQAEDNYNLAQQEQKLGSATQIAVLQAETNLHQAQLNQMSAEKNLLSANEAFKALLGRTDDILVKPTPIDTAWTPPTYTSLNELWQQIETNNPTLLIARQSEKAAHLDKTIAYEKLLPTLSANASNSYSAANFPGATSKWGDYSTTSFSVNLNLPILNIQNSLLNIHDANIGLAQAQVSLQASEIQLRQSAANAFLSYQQAMREVSYAGDNLNLSRELYRLAEEQYRLGQLTLLDLFNTETTLSQARVTYLNAVGDVQIQQAQMDYLLGK